MPPTGAFTCTVSVHTLAAGIVAPVNFTLSLPTAKAPPVEVVKAPPQVLVVTVSNKVILPGAPADVLGNMSTTAALVIAVVVGFVSVIVKVDTAFAATVPGVNDLLKAGACVTVSDWLPAVLAPALLLDTAPAAMVLV